MSRSHLPTPEKQISLDEWLDLLQRDLKQYLQHKYIAHTRSIKKGVLALFSQQATHSDFASLLFSNKTGLDDILGQEHKELKDIFAKSPYSKKALFKTHALINRIKKLRADGIINSMDDVKKYTDVAVRQAQGCQNPVWDLAEITCELYHDGKSSQGMAAILQHHTWLFSNATAVFAVIDSTSDPSLIDPKTKKPLGYAEQAQYRYQQQYAALREEIRTFTQIYQVNAVQEFDAWLTQFKQDLKLYLQHKCIKSMPSSFATLFSAPPPLTLFQRMILSPESTLDEIMKKTADIQLLLKNSPNSQEALTNAYQVIQTIEKLQSSDKLNAGETAEKEVVIHNMIQALALICKKLQVSGHSKAFLPLLADACASLATLSGTVSSVKTDGGESAAKLRQDVEVTVAQYVKKHTKELQQPAQAAAASHISDTPQFP